MSHCYRLDGHRVIPCEVLEWGMWFEQHYEARIVARDELPDGHTISTVFIGLDHGWGEGPPLVFETMVFRPPYTKPAMTEKALEAYREQIGSDPPSFMREEREVSTDDVDCARCSTWEQAEAQHARILRKWRVETSTLRVVNGSED